MSQIAENLNRIRKRVAHAAVSSGREVSAVKLLAVSKTFPADAVAEAYAAGQRCFGENRVQELEAKAPKLPAELEWHQIGHLQANKVRGALQFSSWIHAVDSLPLLQRIERLAAEMDTHPKLLLEVNVSGEESKFGLRPDEVAPLLEWLPSSAPAPVVGLMTMAPFDVPEPTLHEVFGGLRLLRDRLQQETGHPLPELSMGMSGDFEIAIQEGATIVRVGSAIFGHRDYNMPL
ncbi:MAG: YggS family pyridoxal phosphate-dependent enzyme [Victivallales bacterium]|nr:YggS family pyridoxal phosphate-dependent enzyme [Victivallales bacterium]